MPLELTPAEQSVEAFTIGAHHGYAHVNYALAYGTGNADADPSVPGRYDNDQDRDHYVMGWYEGSRQASDDHADLNA